MKRILVAGMGNLLRGDDGFGIRVLQRLASLNLPAAAEIYEAGGAGIALAQKLLDGYDACIIVDAAPQQGKPGSLYRFEPRIASPGREIGMHALSPSEVLLLAQALNALPREVIVIGCEPEHTEELCRELSPAVAQALPEAVKMVLAELERLSN